MPFNCVKWINKGVAISILRDARLTALDCSYSAGGLRMPGELTRYLFLRATLVFVAVCKNIKHSVAKPHAGLPSPLSLLSQTAIHFCKIFKSKSIFFFVISLFVAHITTMSKKKIIKEICVRQALLIISERGKLWTSAILSDLNCWHLFYYSITV